MFNSKAIATLALGIAAVTAVPAHADSHAEGVSISVETQDLNLASSTGQRTLETRLNAAVRQAFGAKKDLRTLSEKSSHRQCETNARDNFVEQQRLALESAKGAERMAMEQNGETRSAS